MFTGTYVKEVYESYHINTATKRLSVILDAKYKRGDLHKVMENQCQNLTTTQLNELLKSLHILEELFDGTLGTWKTDPLDFELNKDAKPIQLRP